MPIQFIVINILAMLLLWANPLCADIGVMNFPANGQCGFGGQGFQIEPVPPVALRLVGPDLASVGSQYTGEGGCGNYSYTFDGGTIDNGGQIGSITDCGTGTISVTDDCGESKSMSVRLPSGGWVQDPSATECYNEGCTTPYYHNTHTEISGGVRKVSIVTVNCCLIEGEAGHTGTCPPVSDNLYDISGLSGEYCQGNYAPYGGMWFSYWGEHYVNWYAHYYSNWECPQ